MQRRMLTRIASILLLLAVLLPTATISQVQAEETATVDDEIIYIDASGRIKIIDPNVAPGTQEIRWESPDIGWFDVAAGDFNGDGDAEIVAIGNNKVTIFDPVMQPNSGLTPDGVINNVPWVRLYEMSVPGTANIVSAGNLDQGVAGDEIVVGYSKPNQGDGIIYEMIVLKRTDAQGRAWTTHATAGFGAPWKFVRAGNIDNQGSEDIVRLRDADTAAIQAAQIDNNWATIFDRNRFGFTYTSAAIGQFVAGGPSEVVVTRTFDGTTEAPSVLVYQFVNNGWTTSGFEYLYFPHPFFAFFADINGNGDDELFWIRDVPSNASAPRMVMINAGGDALPGFEVGLDADNGYRVGAGGDVDADGRDEVVVIRASRIFQFNDPENGPTANTRFWDIAGNGRSLVLANVDGTGYAAADQFRVNLSEVNVSLNAGTFSDAVQSIQLVVDGANPIVQFTVSKENNAPWFNVAASTNTTPATIFLNSFNAVLLKPGTYSDRIVIRAVGANIANSPLYVRVNLTVEPVDFELTRSALAFFFPIGATASKTESIAVSSAYGALTYSTALMPQPPFDAAVEALGEEPSFGYRTEAGDIVLVNALGEEYRIEVPEDAQVSASATVWPSVPWATVQSTGNLMPDTITITATPTVMAQPREEAILLIIADERTGVYPNNIKVIPVIAAKDQFLNFLPRIGR
ncbi:hypothetical protein GC175_18015 [bacterium]|nr:hypothetical protein [bacterium]